MENHKPRADDGKIDVIVKIVMIKHVEMLCLEVRFDCALMEKSVNGVKLPDNKCHH